MRFRTLALALALAFGMTAMADASTARKAVVHKTAKKGTVRRSRSVKARKTGHGKVVKSHR
jgi:hypothetical protein